MTNYQQYQSFSVNILLTLNEYLKKIRPELIKISKDCKVKLSVNVVFRSTKNNNDKRTLCIKSKDTTDIDEISDQLIKKLNDLIKPLKNIDLISEVIESIIYNFTKIIRMNTFVESTQAMLTQAIQAYSILSFEISSALNNILIISLNVFTLVLM